MKYIFIALMLLIHFSGNSQEKTFTPSEQKLIRKCNTARFSAVHGLRMKEFIRLMNLARKDGKLLQKYLRVKFGDEYANKKIIVKGANEKPNHWARSRPLLRPSLGLHAGSWLHAIGSGLVGSTGHQFMGIRALLTFNLLAFVPGNALGENCEYGSKKAVDIFISLMESPGHRANILHAEFYRVGVSKKLHFGYGRNTVTMFSGKKLRDFIFPFLYKE